MNFQRHILIILILTKGFILKSQQEPMFTHYMYNTLWLNPAYAGTRDLLTVTGLHRSQWVNFSGRPQTQSISAHAPITLGKSGAGINIINDKIGPTKSTWVAADYSYHLRLNSKAKLAMGLKALVNILSNNVSQLKLDKQYDVHFAQNAQRVLPNAGFGMYYFTNKFYAGLSCPRLLQNKLTTTAFPLSREQRHYYLISGFVTDLSSNVELKPTAFLRITPGAPVEAELTATFIFSKKLNLGLMHRTGDALGLLTGFNISDQFYFGYSYDWSFTNTTGKYNSGSHEIMLRYDFFMKPESKIKSTRYF